MASTHGALQKGGVAQSKCKNTMYRICTLKRAGGGLKTRTSAKKSYNNTYIREKGSDAFRGYIFYKKKYFRGFMDIFFEQKYYSSHNCDYYFNNFNNSHNYDYYLKKIKPILNPTPNLKKIMASPNPCALRGNS